MKVQKNLAATLLADLPEDPQLRLMAWREIAEILKSFKVVESQLRTEMVAHFFPNPKEGTTNYALGNDWKVTCKQPITRKCDEAVFDAVFKELPRGFKGQLIKFKPELVVSAYRKLSDEHKAIFDEALIISNGSAALEVKAPKVKK